jgi:hypothetical protein
MKTLYRFELDCGRMGTLEGVFVADDSIVTASLGKTVYFGEVLGKHSEVMCTLEEGHFTLLSQDSNVCDIIEEYIGSTGYNPLSYLDEER